MKKISHLKKIGHFSLTEKVSDVTGKSESFIYFFQILF